MALLGDGAATGGMVYEGLNDAAQSGEPMVVILNDNGMSIDPNVGGMAMHLSRLRTQESYLDMKKWYRKIMYKVPGGEAVYKFTRAVKDWVKRSLIPTTIFENMGFTYLGPVDGHDLQALVTLLRVANDMNRPVLVHVITQKGRGYEPAEKDPSAFHGVGKFDVSTGILPVKNRPTFSDSFGDTMIDLAEKNTKVCAITAAMPGGTGLLKFKAQFPDRLFDVGIAEEHAVSMAGGLAKQGMVPVVALYSTFLQRAYDQIMQDIAMLNLHVVLAVDRAGLVGEDGETHHGIYDIGFLRQAPNMRILCPVSMNEQQDMLRWAVQEQVGPVAVRYPRGGDRSYSASDWDGNTMMKVHKEGTDIALVTYGTLLENVTDAAQRLSQRGIQASVIRLLAVHPLPVEQIQQTLCKYKSIVIVVEACAGSGIREEFAWLLSDDQNKKQVYSIDLGRGYVTHGNMDALYSHYGLDGQSIADYVEEVLKVEN